ncbi:hypothetical protein NOH58_25090, partial [Escherichia coli]|nr:hypothetical protein [Escherichia coli]
ALNKENGQKLLSILIAGVGSSFLLLTQRTGFDYLTAGMSVFFSLLGNVCGLSCSLRPRCKVTSSRVIDTLCALP